MWTNFDMSIIVSVVNVSTSQQAKHFFNVLINYN